MKNKLFPTSLIVSIFALSTLIGCDTTHEDAIQAGATREDKCVELAELMALNQDPQPRGAVLVDIYDRAQLCIQQSSSYPEFVVDKLIEDQRAEAEQKILKK